MLLHHTLPCTQATNDLRLRLISTRYTDGYAATFQRESVTKTPDGQENMDGSGSIRATVAFWHHWLWQRYLGFSQ